MKYESQQLVAYNQIDFDCPIRTVQWNCLKPDIVAAGSFRGEIFIVEIQIDKYKIEHTLVSGNTDKLLDL